MLEEKINIEKRNSIKNKLIKAGLFGAAVVGASSVGNAASVFWINEDGTEIDLKPSPSEITSIKKVWTFEKVWNTGDAIQFKVRTVMLENENFFKVYKDGVLIDNGVGWEFNSAVGFKIGSVVDLTDGISLINPVNGSTYKIEYTEFIVPVAPLIALYRTDNKMITRGLPRNCINGDGGKSGLISNISVIDPEAFEYEIAYSNPDTFTLPVYYANRFFCPNFVKGATLPTNWRVEVYKQGRHWTGTRRSESGSYNNTMNSTLCPRYTFTTNAQAITPLMDRKRTGIFFIRLRNTVTNEVSLFSNQRIKTRRFRYISRSHSALGEAFFKATLA